MLYYMLLSLKNIEIHNFISQHTVSLICSAGRAMDYIIRNRLYITPYHQIMSLKQFVCLFGCLFQTSMSIYKMVIVYMFEQIASPVQYIKG